MSTFNMDNQGLSRIILDKIKTKQITPKPRWTFLLKEYVVWFFGFLCLLVGSMAAAVIIFMLRHNGWDTYNQVSGNLFAFIFMTLPYFWLILLGLFVAVGFYNFRHTKKGYRYGVWLIIAGCVFFSFLFGELLYRAGLGQAIDDKAGANLPMYHNVIYPQINLWSQPANGRLAGIIVDVVDLRRFDLLDFNEQIWQIEVANELNPPHLFMIRINERIKIIGEERGNGQFSAYRILPFGPPGRGFFEEKLRNRRFKKPNITPHNFYSQPEIPIK